MSTSRQTASADDEQQTDDKFSCILLSTVEKVFAIFTIKTNLMLQMLSVKCTTTVTANKQIMISLLLIIIIIIIIIMTIFLLNY